MWVRDLIDKLSARRVLAASFTVALVMLSFLVHAQSSNGCGSYFVSLFAYRSEPTRPDLGSGRTALPGAQTPISHDAQGRLVVAPRQTLPYLPPLANFDAEFNYDCSVTAKKDLPGLELKALGVGLAAWVLLALVARTGATRREPAIEVDGRAEPVAERPLRSDGSVAALERLAKLHQLGQLTDEEFAAAKRAVLTTDDQ